MTSWTVGDLTVERVAHLDFTLPTEGQVPEWCVPAFAPSTAEVGLAFSTFVITGAGAPIVVDPWLANDGPRDQPDAEDTISRLLEALTTAGAPPDAVGLVINTHLDGIGWNTRPGPDGSWVPTFPNARYVWPEANLALNAGDDRFAPLRAAGVLDAVELPWAPVPGITLEPGPGHDDGHGVVWVRSGVESACIGGHLFLSPLQVADPSLSADREPATAEQTRRALLDDLTRSGGLLLSPLLGGPGGGRVAREGSGWALIPDS